NAQSSVLSNLLSSPRFARLIEQQAVDGASAWPAADFLAAARHAVWREIEAEHVRIDPYRRNLQRAWLDLANGKSNSNQVVPAGLPPELAGLVAVSGDEKPFYRAELRTLNTQISAALDKAIDRETRAHLEGTRDQIERILDPKFNQSAANAVPVVRIGID